VNYYIIQNYASSFYNGKPEGRAKILSEISNNCMELFGMFFGVEEIERRFKNMRAHYNRKRYDLEAGLIQSCEWQYFGMLDEIFKNSPINSKPRSQASLTVTNGKIQEEKIPIEISPQGMPKLVVYVNKTQKLPKRKSEDFLQVQREVKKEKIEVAEEAAPKTDGKENDEGPLDMSMKRTKLIEFNDVNDISLQLPNLARANDETRMKAIVKISDELIALDTERVNVDEQRLKLEIRRNELDKAAYKLTELLQKLTK
jgi:hypothetical protein